MSSDDPSSASTQESRLPRQLINMPADELSHLAEEIGLESARYTSRGQLAVAVHNRREIIAAMDREAMLDVVKWARRPVAVDATREQLAVEIARIKSMRFAGLSHRGLVVLGQMRGLNIDVDTPLPRIIKLLRKQEGLLARWGRKRRAWLGSIISGMLGDDEKGGEYQFLPPASGRAGSGGSIEPAASIREEIEEQGVIGGLAGRIKRTADAYLKQKLDEIERRIDEKLDEIDKKLGEWRDKEVANRLRILKITMWAAVAVSILSLLYSYIKVYIIR